MGWPFHAEYLVENHFCVQTRQTNSSFEPTTTIHELETSFLGSVTGSFNKFHLFLVFPEFCTFFRGPHSIQCLTIIWSLVGCLNEGEGKPYNLDVGRIAYLNQLSLTYGFVFKID